jgi:hypothetical protein
MLTCAAQLAHVVPCCDELFHAVSCYAMLCCGAAGKPLVLFFYPKAATPGCTKEVGGVCFWRGGIRSRLNEAVVEG